MKKQKKVPWKTPKGTVEQAINKMMAKESESLENPKPVRPIQEAVEATIKKQLDKSDPVKEEGAHDDARVEREPTVVKMGSSLFYGRAALAADLLRRRRKEKEKKEKK